MGVVIDEPDDAETVLSVCESAVIIAAGGEAKLLCGLRGGTVLVFDVNTSENGMLGFEGVCAVC